MRWALLVAVAALSTGCTPTNSPLMRPGEDCMRCHGGTEPLGEGEEQGPTWTVAGTVYLALDAAVSQGVEGALVDVTDAKGKKFTMRTSASGNFYSAEPVTFPLRVQVKRNGLTVPMDGQVDLGSCNSCHTQPPASGAPGRVIAPG